MTCETMHLLAEFLFPKVATLVSKSFTFFFLKILMILFDILGGILYCIYFHLAVDHVPISSTSELLVADALFLGYAFLNRIR